MRKTVTSGSGSSDCAAGANTVRDRTIRAMQAFHFTQQKYILKTLFTLIKGVIPEN
jgi:hypothetical protein